MNFTLPVEFAQAFLLVFARTGSLLMLMPMIGERFVQVRIRLVIALFLSLLLMPMVKPLLDRAVLSGTSIFGVLFLEILMGLAMGLVVRLLVLAADMGSQFITQALGLSLGEMLNPSYDGQTPVLATFFTLLLLTFMFLSDAHHAVIGAVAGSYTVLPPGGAFPVGEMSSLAVSTAGKSLAVAVQIAAPFLVFSVLFNAGLGIISKLMPQIQVAFVAAPLSILLGIFILILVLSAIMMRLSDDVVSILTSFSGR